MIGFFIYTMAD